MSHLKIGIRAEALGLPLRRALPQIAALGVGGVQVDAAGELAPGSLSETGRREFRHLLRSFNLQLTALGCPLRHGLDVAENQQPRIEHVKRVMSLCSDLGERVVVVEAGRIPDDPDGPRGQLLSEAILALSQHGDRIGVTLALETGLESGATLRKFLDRFDTGSLGVNFDPANLIFHGFDVYESLRALAGKIVHTQAKDARSGGASRAAQEVPLGHGDIDWMTYLAVLEEVGYRGWLTIERETGDNRAADVAAAVAFLRRFVG
jgi:L-ribulose-5-phosphate 3-epimerase